MLKFRIFTLASCAAFLLGCGAGSPRFVSRPQFDVSPSEPLQLRGLASYYADEFNGRTTSNGETYDMHSLTAAHRTLPFNTLVRVTNILNHQSVIVRINDRGPFKEDRIIDLSFKAAEILGMIPTGTAEVSLEILQAGSSGK